MENRLASRDYRLELRRSVGPALIAYGLWLRVGFVGASGFAAGLIELVDGGMKPLFALALAAGGAALAAAGWWRARTLLGAADDSPSPAVAAQPAAYSMYSTSGAGVLRTMPRTVSGT